MAAHYGIHTNKTPSTDWKWCNVVRRGTSPTDLATTLTDMLSHLGWKSLETHRKEDRLCMLFKIKHERVAINTSHILIESQFTCLTVYLLYRNKLWHRSKNWNNYPTTTFRSQLSKITYTYG